MKAPRTPKKRPPNLAAAAGPALRRAAKVARKLANFHGTAVCYIKDGKIVTEKQ